MNTLTLEQYRKAFTDALRSGEFSQTQGTLQDNGGYCCLGVACVVYERLTGRALSRNVYDQALLGGTLPSPVKEFYNFRTDLGGHIPTQPYAGLDVTHREPVTLSMLNDRAHYTFKQIADIIDSNPEGLWAMD